MKMICSIAVFLMIGMNAITWGDERVAETLENVDFIVENLKDEKGNLYGEAYYALNHNNYPIRISIKLVQAENVNQKIVPYTIIMEPDARVSLGSVAKNKSGKDAKWKYEWEVEPDLHGLHTDKLAICANKDL